MKIANTWIRRATMDCVYIYAQSSSIFTLKNRMTKMHMYMYMYIKTRIEEGQDAIGILQPTATHCNTLQRTA